MILKYGWAGLYSFWIAYAGQTVYWAKQNHDTEAEHKEFDTVKGVLIIHCTQSLNQDKVPNKAARR